MSIHVTPIPQTLELTTPAFTLGAANAAGSAITAVASDSTLAVFATNALALGATAAAGDSALAVRANSTIAAFDTTIPTDDNYADFFGSSSTTGSAAVASRRDHGHGTTNSFAAIVLLGG
jgi:hypothetical protein